MRGGENHVREQLGVVRVDRARVDRDLHELAGAVCLHRDHAAARRGLADLALRLLLGAHHLLLHLLRLLHQRVHVELHVVSSTSVASRSLTSNEINPCSPIGASSVDSSASTSSAIAVTTASLRPVTS